MIEVFVFTETESNKVCALMTYNYRCVRYHIILNCIIIVELPGFLGCCAPHVHLLYTLNLQSLLKSWFCIYVGHACMCILPYSPRQCLHARNVSSVPSPFHMQGLTIMEVTSTLHFYHIKRPDMEMEYCSSRLLRVSLWTSPSVLLEQATSTGPQWTLEESRSSPSVDRTMHSGTLLTAQKGSS